MNLYTKKPFGGRLRSSSSSWLRLIIRGGILALVFLFVSFFQAPIKNIFYTITAPIGTYLWSEGLGSASFIEPIFNTKGILQENANLKQENQNLLSRVTILGETIKQNNLTQELEKNIQGRNFQTTLAQVVGRNGDTILLSRGSDAGIKENMPVISAQKVLYGRVDKVYKDFSSVMLISHPNSVVDVKIESYQEGDNQETTTLGALKGQGNFSMYLDLVSSDAVLHEGDLVTTSGQEGFFPRNLLLGKVAGADTNDAKPFQTAAINPMFDMTKTDTLFIITNYKKEK